MRSKGHQTHQRLFVGQLDGRAKTIAEPAPQSGLHDQNGKSLNGRERILHAPLGRSPECFNHARHPRLSIAAATSCAVLPQRSKKRWVSKKPPSQEQLEEPALS
jgi:hypothetical protein